MACLNKGLPLRGRNVGKKDFYRGFLQKMFTACGLVCLLCLTHPPLGAVTCQLASTGCS